MVVISLLPQADIGRNDYPEDTPRFSPREFYSGAVCKIPPAIERLGPWIGQWVPRDQFLKAVNLLNLG